jgi:nucleolar protein 16
MGRELQKRKNRSSRAKVTTHNRRKKQLNPAGNSVIARNW